MKYTLREVSPSDPEGWQAYHLIRRKVLGEIRGRYDYQENHPDEVADGHYPMVFCVDGRPVGVVRIDLKEEIQEAIFRRVAIVTSEQRRGFGRKLMEAAESFALERGYLKLVANVATDAIPFYEKIGYNFDPDTAGTTDPNNPRMIKERSG
jgi:GNAT superfamily N-acetyltransferase